MAPRVRLRTTVVAQRHPPHRPLHGVRAAPRRTGLRGRSRRRGGTVGLVVSGRTGWALAAFAWWAAGMTALFFIDLAVMRLPHRITAVLTGGLLGPLAVTSSRDTWLRATAAGLVLASVFAGPALASRGQLGWGDVALALPVAAALCWHSWTAVYTGTPRGRRVHRDHPAPHRPSPQGTPAARPVPDRRHHPRRGGVAATSTPSTRTEGTRS